MDGGKRDLGAAIGEEKFILKFLKDKIEKWTKQMEVLSQIATTQPHAAHAGFIHGVRSKWYFSQRTMKQAANLMKPLENIIRTKFIPSLLGDDTPISETERNMYALPARYSGLGIVNPVRDSPLLYQDSLRITEGLKTLIKTSEPKLIIDVELQKKIKLDLKKKKEARYKAERAKVYSESSDEVQRAMNLASEKGASCLYTTLPLEIHGFTFDRNANFSISLE